MNTWNIVTGIFGIVGVVYAIASAIAIPLYKRAKNKITTKTIVITYNAAFVVPAPPSN